MKENTNSHQKSKMQEKKEEKTMVVPTPLSSPSNSESERFYTKVSDLLESSGMTLILNVRETTLSDLYLVYLEVTRRGGYQQVYAENKWDEIVSALKLEGGNAKLSIQLQNLYLYLLYPFEKLYFYRSPPKQGSTKGTSLVGPLPPENVLTKKDMQDVVTQTNIMPQSKPKRRNHQPKVVKEGKPKRTTKPATSGAAESVEKIEKKTNKRGGAPLGQKNAYHIFLKQECARLKTRRRDLDGRKIVSVVADSWRSMSATEKQPYVEESKKLKEKGKEAMVIDNKEESIEDRRKWEEKRPSVCGETVVNKAAAMDIALEITEKASKDKGEYK